MQSKFKKLLSFISWPFMRSGLPIEKQPESSVLYRSGIYRTCRDLTMDRFLDCLIDDNLEALIINPEAPNKPTRDELNNAWVSLLGEYHEIRGDIGSGMDEFNLTRDVKVLHNHLYLVQTCIDFLSERYTEAMAKNLRSLGYSFKTKEQDPENYRHLLEAVANKAKLKFIELQQLIAVLSKKLASIDTEAKMDRNSFYDALLNFELAFKIEYSINTISVAKYVSLENRYIAMIEKAQNKKHA